MEILGLNISLESAQVTAHYYQALDGKLRANIETEFIDPQKFDKLASDQLVGSGTHDLNVEVITITTPTRRIQNQFFSSKQRVQTSSGVLEHVFDNYHHPHGSRWAVASK